MIGVSPLSQACPAGQNRPVYVLIHGAIGIQHRATGRRGNKAILAIGQNQRVAHHLDPQTPDDARDIHALYIRQQDQETVRPTSAQRILGSKIGGKPAPQVIHGFDANVGVGRDHQQAAAVAVAPHAPKFPFQIDDEAGGIAYIGAWV
jgi:hypothetical protein